MKNNVDADTLGRCVAMADDLGALLFAAKVNAEKAALVVELVAVAQQTLGALSTLLNGCAMVPPGAQIQHDLQGVQL